MTSATVAVLGGRPSTALDLARLGYQVTFVHLGDLSEAEAAACDDDGVQVCPAPAVDVRVTSRWLENGYRLYRAVADSVFDVLVFDGNVADAYPVGRAKETASGLTQSALVVRLPTPAVAQLATRTHISHYDLGTAVTERLSVGLADTVICEPETHAWLVEHGWKRPEHVVEARSAGPGLHKALPAAATRTPPTSGRPLVSVVIPVYERATFLPLCLETLSRQDYEPIEVIVADDGSTSADVASLLDDLERRTWPWNLRVVRLRHGGLAAARNGGWRAASGDLVLFLDDDDTAFDDLVSRTVRAKVAAGADVVVAGARTFDGEGRPEPRQGDRITISLCDPGELTLLGNHSGGPTCLWSRRWLERLDGFSSAPPVVEDWHILVRASLAGARLTTPPDPAWWYRRTPTSMFSANPHGALDAALPTMAALMAETLPAHAQLLPHLVAGAYRELEHNREDEPARSGPGVVRTAQRKAERLAARVRRYDRTP